VLQAISSSTGDLGPVFGTILEKAVRYCDANFGTLFLRERDQLSLVAAHNMPTAFSEAHRRSPGIIPAGPVEVAMRTGRAARVPDLAATQSYLEHHPTAVAAVELGGVRTTVAVPMLKDNRPIGAIAIHRPEVRPFTDKQIDLLANFAAQAVIAIENARLLNELRQRTTDLSEALEQQTAASQVLQIISSSPGELQPVFKAMLENATRICEAKFGVLYRYDDNGFEPTVLANAPAAYASFVWSRGQFFPQKGNGLDRLMHTKAVIHSVDEAAEPVPTNSARLGGARTQVMVPMLQEDKLAGAIAIYRQEVRPFTEKQIALVENFAAQAVIAIENARLLHELRQRTNDLTEALERQTATSDVLQVISSSPGDLEPVFSTMLENAVRICGATFGNIYRRDGEAFRIVTSHNAPPAFVEALKQHPRISGKRMVATKSPIHVADATTLPLYTDRRDPEAVAAVELGGVRTFLAVPMLKDAEVIGAFLLNRQEVRTFTDKQIDLVKNFAAQAVIAIENARLLNELRESLQQQTATADVLKVISRSTFDLQIVFNTLVESAVRLSDSYDAVILLCEGDCLVVKAHNGPIPQDFGKWPLSRTWVAGRSTVDGKAVHVHDLIAEGEEFPQGHAMALRMGHRTILSVPLLRGDETVGCLTVRRTEVRPFTDKQITLVTTFADQAVIAIENARLLKELRERTDEVEKLNQQLEQRVIDQVDEIERMSRLRRFLPPQVADLIVASGSEKQLESHRREITALFCDLRGFTGFTESADAEDVMALLRDYHAAIGEIIIKYNGTLERYAGDGVMVVFNDPVPVENPALQAVLMALEVRVAIGALTERWRRWGHDLGFGIGIAHGFATLGTIGFEGRFDYAAIGTVSNVASRLCDEAKPGQILISPRVLTKVDYAVKVEPVGEFELKGIRRPLAAYNVLSAIA
jgi:GAF domain-containing protein